MSKLSIKNWLKQNRLEILIIVGLLILAGLPRLLNLGLFLTADEKNWIGRSYEFIRAFKDFRFNDMIQTSHPGVTALWMMGSMITLKMYLSHVPFSFNNLIFFVKAAQFPIAVVTTITVPVIYVFLRRLYNGQQLVPLVAASLIALDPLLIGYSRVAHIDALLTHLVFLTALALLLYFKENHSRFWLTVAGILAGLSALTKVPAVFLIPYFILLILMWDGLPQSGEATGGLRIGWSNWNDRGRDFIRWLLIIFILFVGLWPAIIWVNNPLGNVLIIKRDVSIAAITPHDTNEDYSLDTAYYVYALLTRTTPVTLIFASIAIISLVVLVARKRPWSQYRLEWSLVAYVFFFILMMTLGAKKGDRYILPVWPALDVLAALGIVWTAAWLQRRVVSPQLTIGKKQWSAGLVGLLVLAIGYLVVTDWRYHPYAIAYNNPMFPPNIGQELGWGEGLDQVANWLNANHPDAVVASWYPEELGTFTSARVAHINAHEQGNVQFVVLYRNMFGRAPEHYANDFIDEYFKKKDPVFVVHVAGREFAWVYEKRVYENVVGELVPGTVISQAVEATHPNFSGFEMALATYSGKASSGEVIVTLKDQSTNATVQTWRVPVKDIQDRTWQKFLLDKPLTAAPQSLLISVEVTDTKPGDAPTIRYTKLHDYRPGQLTGGPAGDLAIKLRYTLPSGQIATEEDTKLFTDYVYKRPR